MKSAIFSLAFVSGLVAAQIGSIPSCATSCLTTYTSGNGIAGCKQADVKCICSNSSFLDGIACCVQDACDSDDQAATIKYAQQICSSAGVDVPDEVTCKSSSGSSSVASATGSSSTATGSSGSSSTSGQSAATATPSGSSTESASAGSASSSTADGAAAGLGSTSGFLGAIAGLLLAL